MALPIHPETGAILRCNYATGFKPPEMVKHRPVIVISPRLRARNGLCTVVPMSCTPPQKPMPYHCEITLPHPLPAPFDSATCWVKADMLATVGFARLDRFHLKDQYGKRKYLGYKISPEQLDEVKKCILHALGITP